MNDNCTYLPPLIYRKDYKNYQDFFDSICTEFTSFVIGISFKGRKIQLQHPQNNQTIRHIISKENPITSERIPNTSRAERIPWIKQLLKEENECASCKDNLYWAKWHGNKIRWYVYCSKIKYVIILEEYKQDIFYLITAFIVTKQKDKELMKDYQAYIKFGI